MSRFFVRGSDSESESDNEEIIQEKVPIFRQEIVDEEYSEEEERVVRSEKEKRDSELNQSIIRLRSHMVGRDFEKMSPALDALIKSYNKGKLLYSRMGKNPKFFIKAIGELNNFVKEIWDKKEAKSKLSKASAKDLTLLRQKLNKYLLPFYDDLEDFKNNASGYEDYQPPSVSQSMKDIDSDDEKSDREERKIKRDSVSSKGEKAKKRHPSLLKTEEDSYSAESRADQGSNDEDHLAGDKFQWKKDKKSLSSTSGHSRSSEMMLKIKNYIPENTQITLPLVLQKVREIVKSRGKKSTDKETLTALEIFLKLSDDLKLGDALMMKLLFLIIPLKLELSTYGIDTAIRLDAWKFMRDRMKRLCQLLISHPKTILKEYLPEDEEVFTTQFRIQGNPLMLLSILNEEFVKILQNCDCYSNDYVERLRHQNKLIELCKMLEIYFSYCHSDDHDDKSGSRENEKRITSLCEVYLLHLELIYYKMKPSELQALCRQLNEKAANTTASEVHTVENTSSFSEEAQQQTSSILSSAEELEEDKQIEQMCCYIHTHGHDRAKTRAVLFQIYHLALNERWNEARDLFHMSHLQDSISHSDICSQGLYNRTLAQLGLSAFRSGFIKEAFLCLHELQSCGRAKELLSQGIILAKNSAERNLKLEQVNRRQLLPFHMHLNLELIESVFLTCSILLEVPYMASNDVSSRKKIISRNMMYLMRLSDKQPIVGPPETSRERLVSAAKSMQQGYWRRCADLLLGIRVWNLLSNAQQVRQMLLQKVKEESVKAYLFVNRSLFKSISLLHLSDTFQLSESELRRIVNKSIMLDDLKAGWDATSEVLTLLPDQIPGTMKMAAMGLTDKVTSILDQVDRIHDSKTSLLYLKDKVDSAVSSLPESCFH